MQIKSSLIAAGLALSGGPVFAQAPLSAIDWLSESVTDPIVAPTVLFLDEDPVTPGGTTEIITVTPLDATGSDAVGLLPISVTGLPANLWGSTPSASLAGLFAGLQSDLLPATQDLLFTLLLAELNPPADSDPASQLFIARIDALLGLGAVEQAQALLERAGVDKPEAFRRWFDASLLNETEDAACGKLQTSPGLAPTMPARIFCLARSGDWNAAALTLETGRALGQLDETEDALLARFLDAELFEGKSALSVPNRPSPLNFRLYEAIGESLPTTNLPLAFAQADLRSNTGWKAQIEAAERLARSGALSENKLLGLYSERRPAASGGVWDRVAALQALDTAIVAKDSKAAASALDIAWNVMRRADLEVVFAHMYAYSLRELSLDEESAALAFRIDLLTAEYEVQAQDRATADTEERFLKAVARGDLVGVPAPNELARAISDGFQATSAPENLARLLNNGDLGAAILRAIGMATEGARGDLEKLSGAIALFHSVGLEDVARRTALQVMILDRRG